MSTAKWQNIAGSKKFFSTGGKTRVNVTSSIPEGTKIIAPVDHIVEQQVVFMWGSSYIRVRLGFEFQVGHINFYNSFKQ